MNKKNLNPENLEKSLATYYQAASPSNQFLEQLEAQLNQAKNDMEAEKIQPGFFETLANFIFKQQKARWAVAVAAIALIMVMVLFAIGPARVAAAVQNWLRYIPGYGFVKEGAARALASPVSETRDGVVVTIKQIYAGQDETYVIIGVEGGPSADEILKYMQPLPGENLESRVNRIQALYETDAHLILPDGTVLAQPAYGGSYWDGYFIFKNLPQNVLEATLEISRLPGVPAGWLPEGWAFDLKFEYVDSPNTLEFPQPHFIDAVSAPLHGFRARVLDVVYASTETSIRVQFDGLPEGWVLQSAFLDARLEDDMGREIPIIYGPQSGRDQDGIYTITFAPPQSDARKLTLSINELFVEVRVQDRFIHIDFGDSPAIGKTIELGTAVDVLGQQVVVKSVQIQDSPPFDVPTQGENVPPTNTLVFDLLVPKKEAGVEIHGLNFGPTAHAMFGQQTGGMSGSMSNPQNPGQIQIVLTIDIPANEPLPRGVYDLPLEGASVLFQGPYQVTWDIDR